MLPLKSPTSSNPKKLSANLKLLVRRAELAEAASAALVASATLLDAFAGILSSADIVAHCAHHNTPEQFAFWIADPGSVVTLAVAANGAAPVGYTVLTKPDLPVERRSADIELKRIYTLSRVHGTGLGPELMQRAFEDARAMDKLRVLLGVYSGNARARAFYERQGFVVVGTRHFRVGATLHDDAVYARTL